MKTEFFNNLGFVAARLGAQDDASAPTVALLADENGERIPGQCAITISKPDHNGVRTVAVVFEVMADIPEGCATSCNWKE